MAPLAPTVRHFPGFCLRKKFPNKCITFFTPGGGGGGVGTRRWWLALLAYGGAYWPLALEPSAMTSRHPYYCGHPPS